MNDPHWIDNKFSKKKKGKNSGRWVNFSGESLDQKLNQNIEFVSNGCKNKK